MLTACSSSGLSVYYDSSPRSARLICGGEYKGETPQLLSYTISEDHIKQGAMSVVPCQAVWMGGAVATYQNQFPINSESHYYEMTAVSNNVNAVDVQYATQRAAQRYAAAAQQAQTDPFNIQGIGQNQIRRTYCNRYGSQVICQTF